MMGFLIKLIINIAALFIVINTVGGVRADNWQALVTASVVIGFLNAFLRPVIILLTIPINILSLGLFTLIINGSMFYFASKFVKGFVIADFWSAFWAALIFSIVSFILSMVFSPKINFRFNSFGSAPKQHKYTNVIDVEGEVVGKQGEDNE